MHTKYWTLPSVLADTAARLPGHIAVVAPDGGTTTYAELRDLVDRWARAYHASGVRHGDRVAVWLPNGLGFISAMLGAQSLGAAVVPLNTRFRGAEARVILARSRAKVLVLDNGFLGKDYEALLREGAKDAEAGPSGLPGLPHLELAVDIGTGGDCAVAEQDFLTGGDAVDPAVIAELAAAVSPDDVCDILFTSGTTGQPKGVMSAHRQTIGVGRVWAEGADLQPADRYAIVNPLFHGFGYKAGLVSCIDVGATMYPLPVFDIDGLLSLVERERITVLPGAPTIFTSLLDHPTLGDFDISSLRFSIAGAATVPESLFADMRTVLGFDRVAQAYGLTECIVATMSRREDGPEHIQETTGPGVAGIEVRVVDSEGADVATGADGEILLRGDNVMLGYFEDPEATAAAIEPDGWFHTGDIGRLDEHGCLKITDRLKDMLIVGGFNVYPAEIENVLREHPAVNESAVVGVDDARLGTVARAYVLLYRDADPAPTQAELIAFCQVELANYKVPREIVFVEEFERNATGKILKTALR